MYHYDDYDDILEILNDKQINEEFEKIEGTKNGYKITEKSTNDGFKKLLDSYKKEKIKCIIGNKITIESFKRGIFTSNKLTINNKLPNGHFYINGIY